MTESPIVPPGEGQAETISSTGLKSSSEMGPKNTGAERIAVERARQVGQEGWTPEHDDAHAYGEIVTAAMCYAVYASGQTRQQPVAVSHRWPWESAWWKPSDDPIRNLVKAGALIAAEIDRLQRKQS